MNVLFPWFDKALTLTRVYEGPVPESGREGIFLPAHYTIWHLKKGGFQIDLNRKVFHLEAPTWVLIPPGPRRQMALPGTRMVSIHFQLEARALATLGWPGILCCDDVNGVLAEEVTALLGAFQRTGLEPLAYLPAVPVSMQKFLEVQGAFLKFLSSFLGMLAPQLEGLEGRNIDPRLEEVRRAIAALPLNIPPDLDAISARIGLSLRQVNRLHAHAFTLTCNEYWDQLRAESARIGLANPSRTIKEVALSLGFTDISFFSNWFLRHEACRPREFRQHLLESLRSR